MWRFISRPTWVDEIVRYLRTLNRKLDKLMAIGTETQTALDEVKAAIVTETDQAAEKIIDVLGADAETAAEVRKLLAPIKGIIPDPAATPDPAPAPDAPAGEQ